MSDLYIEKKKQLVKKYKRKLVDFQKFKKKWVKVYIDLQEENRAALESKRVRNEKLKERFIYDSTFYKHFESILSSIFSKLPPPTADDIVLLEKWGAFFLYVAAVITYYYFYHFIHTLIDLVIDLLWGSGGLFSSM